MTETNFIYWLNGFFEISGVTELNNEQVKIIKEHLALVLTKVTPTPIPTRDKPSILYDPTKFPFTVQPDVAIC